MKELLKKWYVLVIVLLVISTIVFACLFVSTNKKLTNAESEVSKLEEKLERNKNKNKKETGTTYADTQKDSSKKTSEEKLKENIKIEYVGMTKAGDFVMKVVNNNDEPVHISEITTIYKDANDTFMKKATSNNQYFGIEANSETYVHNWGYKENYAQYPKYEFDFSFSGSWNFNDSVIGNYEVKANNTGEHIAVEIKNNNSKSIRNVAVGTVFYKDNQIVGYVNGYDYDNTTANGKSVYVNVAYPQDGNYKDVAFDDYKVFVLNAEKAD